MFRSFRPLAGLLLALAFVAAGCDSAATGGDLLTDARIARQSGDLDRAIELYSDALRAEPDNAIVRTELAGTQLDRAGVDLLDLSSFVDFLTDAAPAATAAAPAADAARGATCEYASQEGAVVIDPRDVVDFEEVFENRDIIQLAMDILQGEQVVLAGNPLPAGVAVIPDEITAFSVCTGIQDSEIVLDRAGAVASMQALGLTNQQISAALAVDALSRFIDAYFYVTVDLPQATTWYRLADGSIGICADDPDQLRVDAEAAVQNLGRAIAGLDLRAHVLGAGPSDPVRQIVDEAVDAYTEVEDDLAPYCRVSF